MSLSKSLKREREDESQDSCKKERLLKTDESEPEYLNKNDSMDFEGILKLINKDGGLSNVSAVDQVLRVMHKVDKDFCTKSGGKVSQRGFLSSIIVATKDEECLSSFLELGCVLVLDEWLRDAHEGRLQDDQGSVDGGEKGTDELILTLLGALSRLRVNLDAVEGCTVGKSVSNLLLHTNPEIQKKAKNLVDTWEKRMDTAVTSDGDEQKQGLNPVAGNQSLDDSSKIICNNIDVEAQSTAIKSKEALLSKEISTAGDISEDTTTTCARGERNHASSQSLNGNSCMHLSREGYESQENVANCSSQGPNSEPLTGALNDSARGKQVSGEKTAICSDGQLSDTQVEDKELIYSCTIENGGRAPFVERKDHESGRKPSGAGDLDRIKSSLGSENAVTGGDIHPLASIAACEACESERCGLSKSLVVENVSRTKDSSNAGDIKDVKPLTKELGEQSGISLVLEGKTDENVAGVSVECAPEDMEACLIKTGTFPTQEKCDVVATTNTSEVNDEKGILCDEKGCNESEKGRASKVLSSFNVKGEELVDEYEEEDALEIARWVAKEVEQEIGSRLGSPSSPQISDKNDKTSIDCDRNPEASPSKRKDMAPDSVSDSVRGLESAEAPVGSETIDKTETKITVMVGSLVTEGRPVDTSTCGANQGGVPLASLSTKSLENEVMESDSTTAPSFVPAKPVKTPLDSEGKDCIKTASGDGCQGNGEIVSAVLVKTLMESEDIDKKESMIAPMIESLTKDSLVVSAECGSQANELSVPELPAAVVENECAALTRPIFDLNEGLASDDVVDEEPSLSTITVVAHVPAPISVVSDEVGFVPPSDLVRSAENLGQKGTDAFMQAEPHRARESPLIGMSKESCKPPLTTIEKTGYEPSPIGMGEESCKPPLTGIGKGECEPPPNTARSEEHKILPGVPGNEVHESAPTGTTAACGPGTIREACKSPSTRTIDEAREPSLHAVTKESSESLQITTNQEPCEQSQSNIVEGRIDGDDWKRVKKFDIDLNVADDTSLEEDACCSKSNEHNSFSNVGRVEFDLNTVEQGEEPTTACTSGSTGPIVRVVRDFDLNDGPGAENYCTQEAPLAIPLGVRTRIVDEGAPSYSLDPSRSMVTFSGSGGGDSTYLVQPPRRMPNLQYPGSSSYNVVSPFERLVTVIDADPNPSCSRPSLDLNAGPENTIERDPPSKWQAAASSLPFPPGASSSSSSGGLKRKEPDGGFDPFRSGLKHMVGSSRLFPPSS